MSKKIRNAMYSRLIQICLCNVLLELCVTSIPTLIITLQPKDDWPLQDQFQAIPASQVETCKLPLYTQYMLDHGRRFHMEIGNKEMVACFLSHIAVWELILSQNQTTLVLEEDALLSVGFYVVIQDILAKLENETWDIVMLGGRIWHVAEGNYINYNEHLLECKTPRDCSWFGTRGYLLHPGGAKKLLGNIPDMVIQVDAYISLMNSYYPQGFKLLWSKQELVHGKWMRMSTVWDACFICYMSPFVSWVILSFIFVLVLIIWRTRGSVPKARGAPIPPCYV